jgi:hypothetical protein
MLAGTTPGATRRPREGKGDLQSTVSSEAGMDEHTEHQSGGMIVSTLIGTSWTFEPLMA